MRRLKGQTSEGLLRSKRAVTVRYPVKPFGAEACPDAGERSRASFPWGHRSTCHKYLCLLVPANKFDPIPQFSPQTEKTRLKTVELTSRIDSEDWMLTDCNHYSMSRFQSAILTSANKEARFYSIAFTSQDGNRLTLQVLFSYYCMKAQLRSANVSSQIC